VKVTSNYNRVFARIRLIALVVATVSASTLTSAVLSSSANAQTPSPTLHLADSATPTFPSGANAGIVEATGLIGRCGSLSSAESTTVSWTDSNKYVITEVSPQDYSSGDCGTISQYETALSSLVTYVETYGHNPGTYWGGIMLDEEPGYDFSVSQLETLNNYVDNLMVATSGVSWFYTENQPTSWSSNSTTNLQDYNGLISSSWAAPQAYNQNFINVVNSECSTYSVCENLATVDKNFSGNWGNEGYVLPLVHGDPWSSLYWGTGNWWNAWY
jgi:hypothetical protein